MQVVILGIEPEHVLAHVAGIEAVPNCGARQTTKSTAKLNSAFCKQMVAVTLAANVIGSNVAADGDGTALGTFVMSPPPSLSPTVRSRIVTMLAVSCSRPE